MTGDFDPPVTAIREAVGRALAEDLGVLGDLTSTALIPADAVGTGHFVARSSGVLAGTAVATEVFAQLDPAVTITWAVADSDGISAGQRLGIVHGSLRSVLAGERSRAGGGANHRGNLSDAVLVKDNHLRHCGIGEAVSRARRRWPGAVVEVECDTLDQVSEAKAAGADLVLVDNMSPDEVARAVSIAGGALPIEVSGGVTLEGVAAYAAAGADLISVGALTHSAPVLDIALDLE